MSRNKNMPVYLSLRQKGRVTLRDRIIERTYALAIIVSIPARLKHEYSVILILRKPSAQHESSLTSSHNHKVVSIVDCRARR